MQIITIKQAKLTTGGGLTQNSKMPCPTYNLPPSACKTGSKLASMENSICSDCYACKGFSKVYKSIDASQHARLDSIDSPDWVESMIKLIKPLPFFRFHSAGDIQSAKHFKDIVTIIEACPDTRFWIPTRERGIIKDYLKSGGRIPKNLTLRLSATRFDEASATFNGLPTSTSHKDKEPIGFECRAPSNNGECGTCRACWDSSVSNVSYKRH